MPLVPLATPRSLGPNWKTQLGIFLLLCVTMLALAPNFQWESHLDENPYGADFLQEWVGAKMILTGNAASLYDQEVFGSWQHDDQLLGFSWNQDCSFPPVYPPVHYLLFSPFAALPYAVATSLWVVLLLGASLASARLLMEIVQHDRLVHLERKLPATTGGRSLMTFLWIGLFLFPSVMFSIAMGQKSVVWLLILAMTFRLLQTRREWTAGAIFGILSIKPTLFFLLPLVMLRNGQWRFVSACAISSLSIWGIAACMLPKEVWQGFIANLGQSSSYAAQAGYRLDWSCNLMAVAYSLPSPWIEWAKWAYCVPLAIYTLVCVFEKRNDVVSPVSLLTTLIATFLLSPHAYQYDLTVLVLPILWIAARQPTYGLAYYASVSVATAIAAEAQSVFHMPIIPVVLISILCEIRLRPVLAQRQAAKIAAEFA